MTLGTAITVAHAQRTYIVGAECMEDAAKQSRTEAKTATSKAARNAALREAVNYDMSAANLRAKAGKIR